MEPYPVQQQQKIVHILSIDGGGVRGILPATILRHIEEQTGRPIQESFNVVAGASTGGLIALSTSLRDPLSADEILKIYLKKGKTIFHQPITKYVTSLDGMTGEKYSTDKYEKLLNRYFHNRRLSDLSRKMDVLVPAYDIEKRRPIFFKSWMARGEHVNEERGDSAQRRNFRIRDVALATSAAPTYFEPCEVRSESGERYALIDGGIFANNPAMCALAEARRLYPRATGYWMLSLGTGRHVRPIRLSDAKDYGEIAWMKPLISCIFDSCAESVDYEARHFLLRNYVRVDTELKCVDHGEKSPSDDMDDVSDENVKRLREKGQHMLNMPEVREAVNYLKHNRKVPRRELV